MSRARLNWLLVAGSHLTGAATFYIMWRDRTLIDPSTLAFTAAAFALWALTFAGALYLYGGRGRLVALSVIGPLGALVLFLSRVWDWLQCMPGMVTCS